jgi:hypothetical protein
MLALILWWTLGWRFGLGELLGEVALAAAILGGGGGSRVLRTLRVLWHLPLPVRSASKGV